MATVRIPGQLRKYTHGLGEVLVVGSTVGEILTSLDTTYPGIKERICDESGALRRFVRVFVKDEDIRVLEQLDTPVKDTDEVSIVPAMAGG